MDTPTSLADKPPIAERELHRERVSLAKEAESSYAGAGWTAHQLWRRLNEELFGRQMCHCEIRFGELPSSHFGLWSREENTIFLSSSLLRRDGSRWWLHHTELGSRFPKDVLLRQMVFQYLEIVRGIEVSRPSGSSAKRLAQNREWIGETNRLSKEMELNRPNRDEAQWWPYSVRPEGYYEGDWRTVVE
jgi:hypothetical protein